MDVLVTTSLIRMEEGMVAKKLPDGDQFLQEVQKAVEAGDSQRVGELFNELIGEGERTGAVDATAARKLRLDAATLLVSMAPLAARQKVTLSLPDDVLQALRLASAESGKEMSLVVSDALRTELQKYQHASQALRKLK
jgi:hypothetical protein